MKYCITDMTTKSENKKKNILFITTTGGGGHIQAAKAKALQMLKDAPNSKIIQRDIILDWVGKYFGKCFVGIWNLAQKKGNLKVLGFYSKNVPTADILFWIPIFIRSLITIIREDVDHIIDTQPVGTSAVIKAIKCARRLTNKPIYLEKIITELPTDKVIHFFTPIKKLSTSDRTYLKLVSTMPLLKKDETEEAFWKKTCGLSAKEVRYEDFPLRPIFQKYAKINGPCSERITLQIEVKSSEEKFLIANTVKRGTTPAEIYREKIAITIEPEDKVSTILLGSQPTEEATINYVKNFIFMGKKEQNLCGRHLLFCLLQ